MVSQTYLTETLLGMGKLETCPCNPPPAADYLPLLSMRGDVEPFSTSSIIYLFIYFSP
jgi:hypothetical protein